LLGNPPSPALFPTFSNQVRLVLEDLRSAGVPEMRNPDIGWKLEVANFAGSWPHSHTKMMVVDGETVIGAGYNLQYAHYPSPHVSGYGKDKIDLGLQITGPVAQAALRAFDDVWEGSTRVHCDNIDPDSTFFWMFSCHTAVATRDHVPEVLHYFVPDAADGKAFSLPRTENFRQADEAYYAALASAQSSIDTIQVNFTLEMICDLGVLLEVCNFANRIEPMDAIMKAIETNQAQVRVLIKETPIDGIENRIAIAAFQNELAARGLSEYVEIRFVDADQVHPKASLIDGELLVVGSHNFHYSAWGDGALTEYNLAIEDPVAAQDFKKFFDFTWEKAKKVE
jgi:phosphatidylserine/phosphatidylglycerophosphate/cardiolipin synthase-like enzyme